jgi:hypothetical protein
MLDGQDGIYDFLLAESDGEVVIEVGAMRFGLLHRLFTSLS